MTGERVAVAGYGVHVPGADAAAGLPALAGVLPDEPACPAERAHELLGRKGLLGKDAATRLALCAVHRALGLPARAARRSGPPDPGTAVVASSNLGNVSSVVDVARAVRTGGRRAVSPLAAPNVSSNVVASAVAIWFRFGGPNLMVCSGAPAGLDAVSLGVLLLRAGRARRVVVVGAEAADPDAVALYGTAGAQLRSGAAGVVLTPAADAPGMPLLTVGDPPGPDADLRLGLGGADPLRAGGDLYGAQGVVLVALAAAVAGVSAPGTVIGVSCGSAADGRRAVRVSAPAPG